MARAIPTQWCPECQRYPVQCAHPAHHRWVAYTGQGTKSWQRTIFWLLVGPPLAIVALILLAMVA